MVLMQVIILIFITLIFIVALILILPWIFTMLNNSNIFNFIWDKIDKYYNFVDDLFIKWRKIK